MKKGLFLVLLLALLTSKPASLAAESANNYLPNVRSGGSSAARTIGDEQVEAKDPMIATVFSVLPGIVLHGFGNFYGGDYNFGSRLLVMEILGIGLGLWGHNIIHQQENWGAYFGDQTPQAGYWIKATGLGMVTLSWVADVATAHEAADQFNKDHQVQFQIDTFNGEGARLSLATQF